MSLDELNEYRWEWLRFSQDLNLPLQKASGPEGRVPSLSDGKNEKPIQHTFACEEITTSNQGRISSNN